MGGRVAARSLASASKALSVPNGLVNDYDIALETGTNNAASLLAAAATGKPVYVPAGNYFADNPQVDRLIEDGVFYGPGRIWSAWSSGDNEQQGKIAAVGIPSPVRGEIGAGGLGLGFAGVMKNGPFLWASSPNGYASKPKTVGYHEFNLYPTLPIGMGIGQAGTSNVLFEYGDLSLAADYIEVGDLIGFGPYTYKYAGAVSGGFAINTTADVPVNFPVDTLEVFRWCYDIREGVCNVAGKILTIDESQSDFLFGFFYSGSKNRVKIGGTWYAVESIQSPTSLTLVTDLGTLTEVSFIQKTHFGVATGFRLQSMFGGREENIALLLNERGEAVVSLQGYAGAGYTRKMPLVIEGGVGDGVVVQVRDSAGNSDDLKLNPSGGNFGVGANAAKDKIHATDGAIRASGNTENFNSVAGALMDYYNGWARWVAAGAGDVGHQFYTTVGGSSALRMQIGAHGYLSLPGTPTCADDAAAAAMSPPIAVGELYKRSSDGALVVRMA